MTTKATAPVAPAASPDRPAPVTEVELAALKRDRALLDALKTQEKALAKNLDDCEAELIARIETGAEIVGDLQPTVKLGSRKNISWLTAFAALAKRLGLDDKSEVAGVKDAAPASFYKELQIP